MTATTITVPADSSTSWAERTVAAAGLGATTTAVQSVRSDSSPVVSLRIASNPPWGMEKKSLTWRRSAASRVGEGERRRHWSTKKR